MMIEIQNTNVREYNIVARNGSIMSQSKMSQNRDSTAFQLTVTSSNHMTSFATNSVSHIVSFSITLPFIPSHVCGCLLRLYMRYQHTHTWRHTHIKLSLSLLPFHMLFYMSLILFIIIIITINTLFSII